MSSERGHYHDVEKVPRIIMKYAEFVDKRPRFCLAFSIIVMAAFCGLPFMLRDDAIPDFANADKGFTPRGTKLATAATAFRYNMNWAVCKGDLTSNENGEPSSEQWNYPADESTSEDFYSVCRDGFYEDYGRSLQGDQFLQQQPYDSNCLLSRQYLVSWTRNPVEVVYKAVGSDLLDFETVQGLCEASEEMRSKLFDLGTRDVLSPYTGAPCTSRDIGTYVKNYYGLGECSDITSSHVSNFSALLGECAPAFQNASLEYCPPDRYIGNGCSPGVQEGCLIDNIVYDTLNQLVDAQYLDSGNVRFTKMIPAVTDWDQKTKFTTFHDEYLFRLDGERIGSSEFAGYRSGSKFDAFSSQIISDSLFSVAAFVAIFLLMWVHSSSFFITVFAWIQIFVSLGVSYGVYMCVLWLPFFPFLNLVGLFVVIGVACDDVFIFVDAWKQCECADTSKRLGLVLYRAGGSMFVTTITSVAAFLANSLSPVTSMRCFGVFVAIVIAVDFVIMMTYIPAVVLIHERYIKLNKWCTSRPAVTSRGGTESTNQKNRLCFDINVSAFFRDKVGPFVIQYRIFLLVSLLAMACGLTFAGSKLERPTTGEFQLYRDTHPMEVFELELEKNFFQYAANDETAKGVLTYFVLGIELVDNGNFWDPDDFGRLVLSKHFNISSPQTQAVLLGMCDTFAASPYYTSQALVCPLKGLKDYIAEACSVQRATCCDMQFPISNATLFESCVRQYSTWKDGFHGFWYDAAGSMKAIVFRFRSNLAWDRPYDEQLEFETAMDTIVNDAVKEDPALGGMFFFANIEFFDLQRTLSASAFQSGAVSFAFATCILLVTTRSVRVTAMNMVTVVQIVGTIVGILVSLGWQLNIMESLILAVAVGLSVDHTVHFSYSFLHSPYPGDRRESVLYMFKTVGVSIFTGAFTTFVAGFVMIFSTSLFFWQFGVFLMVAMASSWIFANFSFSSLLVLLGPEKKGVLDSKPSSVSLS